jgi:hypothetical protein
MNALHGGHGPLAQLGTATLLLSAQQSAEAALLCCLHFLSQSGLLHRLSVS